MTGPSGVELSQRSLSLSDVLGEPFSTGPGGPGGAGRANGLMARSSTMPLNGEAEETPAGSTASIVGSISSMAGSGVKSLLGSKAANRGLKGGRALLSSAWTSFSPQTPKNTKEALHSIRSGLSSAATNLSKKYGDLTLAQSPQVHLILSQYFLTSIQKSL